MIKEIITEEHRQNNQTFRTMLGKIHLIILDYNSNKITSKDAMMQIVDLSLRTMRLICGDLTQMV